MKMRQKKPFLSVIIPVYNEEQTLSILLGRVLKNLPKNSEVIVVNDGSTDRSAKILKAASQDKRITGINLSRNRGKGYALRRGFTEAKGEVFLIQDADLEYNPKDYPKLLKPLKDGKAEVVYGSRLINHPLNLKNLTSMPLPLNFLANKILSLVTNILYGCKLTDMETGYKLFSRKVYKSLKLSKNGFAIEPEITAKIIKAGFSIQEVSIETQPRTYSQGKKITWRDGFRAFYTLLQYRLSPYYWGTVGVTVLAIAVRFYKFSTRYGLWSDQARDALVGRVSLANKTLPLIGSFSSAGPFTFGPFWYWQSAAAAFIFRSHMGYWIVTGIFSVLMTMVLLWIGKKLGGRYMSLVLGIIAAISFTQVQSSLGSTQHSMVSIFSTFFLAMIIVYLNRPSAFSLFWTGFFLSTAVNYHYQAFYLIPTFIALLLVKRPKFKTLLAGVLGGVLPLLPLLIFDLGHQFWNFSKMLDYYRFGQYRIYVPNRWLTYAGLFWPDFWAKTAGGYRIIAYGLMLGIGAFFSIRLWQKKLKTPLVVYGWGFLAAIVWFRYFRGERFDGYVAYAQPLVLIFTAWLLSQIYRRAKSLGIILTVVVIAGSLSTIYRDSGFTNSYTSLFYLKTQLSANYPQQAFTLYDKAFITTGCSIPLSLILDDDQLAAEDGLKIGVCNKNACPPDYPAIASSQVGEFDCQLVLLKNPESITFKNQQWILVSPQAVNKMTVEWWK